MTNGTILFAGGRLSTGAAAHRLYSRFPPGKINYHAAGLTRPRRVNLFATPATALTRSASDRAKTPAFKFTNFTNSESAI